MGIFNFLKKFKTEQLIKEPAKVKFRELERFIQLKEQENKSNNRNILKSVNCLLLDLIEELNPKIQDLEDIDLTEKKAEEKIKLIVRENLNNYINHLRKLLTNLRALTQEENLHNLTTRLNSAFNDFYNLSSTNFQKATFLIGKEIGDVTDSLNYFSKKFRNILKENKEVIFINDTLNNLKKELTLFENHEKSEKQIKNSIEEIRGKTKELESKKDKLNRVIGVIKEGEEYKKELENQRDIEIQKQDLEKEIYSLKNLIDFKELANIYHSNEKEMGIIKDCRENFKEAFEKDKGTELLDIISFIQKTGMDKQAINKKTEQIIKNQDKIKNLEDNSILRASADILIKESEIRILDSDVRSLINQQVKENKRLEKIQGDLKKIINKIEHQLAEINVQLF